MTKTYLKNIFPRDIRWTVCAFLISSILICASLACLFFALPHKEAYNIKSLPELAPYASLTVRQLDDKAVSAWLESTENARLHLLASAVERAAGNESYAIRVSVGALLLNRLENENFPSSLSAVIAGAGLYPESTDIKVSERSYHAASAALMGVDPTFGALYIISTDDAFFSEYKDRVSALYGNFAFIR